MKNKNLNVNLDIKNLLKQSKKLFNKVDRYKVIIIIIIVVGLYGYLIMQISSISQKEPTQNDVNQQLSTVKRLKIDQDSIDKMQQLEDQNVVVQSLFETARDNPFSE